VRGVGAGAVVEVEGQPRPAIEKSEKRARETGTSERGRRDKVRDKTVSSCVL
jgi:hypothetical protein